ncbi:MAG: hypothetical protein IPM24_06505 [Bryobacterales bacterium]|nr:hypothetical protein [Bryobacterales bacterium]
MAPWLCLLALAAAPFWEAKAPSDWTEEEIAKILSDSPWARGASAEGVARYPDAATFLATAAPVRAAEEERRRRRGQERDDPDDFPEFLRSKGDQFIVLAVRVTNPVAFADSVETTDMEKECVLRVGRRKYPLAGHFPPLPSDPYLRLVFPREIRAGDKSLNFQIYVPGLTGPYREVEYPLKDLLYKGKPEL